MTPEREAEIDLAFETDTFDTAMAYELVADRDHYRRKLDALLASVLQEDVEIRERILARVTERDTASRTA